MKMTTDLPVPKMADPLNESQVIESLLRTISPSRLSLFLQCRLKFWFRYVARLPKQKSAALHLGSTVHAVLKVWNKARWRNTPLTLKQLHDEYANAWMDQSIDPIPWEDGQEETEKVTGWRLVETYIRESKIPPDLRPDAVEVPAEADLAEHGLPNLIGVLDLVQGGVIIDYKTSGQTPHAERSIHIHEIQTTSYSVLYRASTNKREAGIEIHTLVKLKTPKLVITAAPPVTTQQRDRLFHLIEAYQSGMSRRDFIPSPGMHCSACEFFNECRAWS